MAKILASAETWYGRAQTIWVWVPLWGKGLAVALVSASLGLFEELPMQAVFLLMVMTFAFGLLAVLMVNELIRTRNEEDDELQLSKPRPKVMVKFHEQVGRHANGLAIVVLNLPHHQFAIENVGEEAALNVVVHDVSLTNRTIRFERVPEALKAAHGGVHRITLGVAIGSLGDLEPRTELAEELIEEMQFQKGATVARWPLVISYCDHNGRRYETQGNLVCDKASRSANYEFLRCAYVSALSPMRIQ